MVISTCWRTIERTLRIEDGQVGMPTAIARFECRVASNNLTFRAVTTQTLSIFWRDLLYSQFVAARIAEIA